MSRRSDAQALGTLTEEQLAAAVESAESARNRKNKGPYGAVLNMSQNDLQVTSETPQHAIGTSKDSIRSFSEDSNSPNERRAGVEVPGNSRQLHGAALYLRTH